MGHIQNAEFASSFAPGRRVLRMHRPWSWLTAMVMVGVLMIAPGLRAQTPKPTDIQVKAAYLYNFGHFVEWPSSATEKGRSFDVCVLGQDPFGPILDSTLAGGTVAGRNVVARRISNPQESGSCRILFLSSSEEGRLNEVIAALDKSAVLTVSDIPQFSRRGGMIEFVLEGNKVRFEVNLTAAKNAGLVLSSELLRVATAVRRDAPHGD